MIKGKDIIVVGIQAWDIEIGSNCKNIALELSKNNRVLYVNPPMTRAVMKSQSDKETIQKRIRIKNGEEDSLVEIGSNLWNLYPKTLSESINWLPVHLLFKILNKRNAIGYANDIKVASASLDFKNVMIFNDSSMFLGPYLKKLLNAELYIYYIRDNLITQDYFKKHGVRLEEKTIKSADLVVSNSTYLRDYAKPFNSNAYYVGQGCDLELFKPNEVVEPADLAKIKGVKIGYIGFLTEMRLNIHLLVEIAKTKTDWQIILVGPEDNAFKDSDLHKLSNVHFLGNKKGDELPAYIKYFDICMNPQEVNALTIGNYPRKIDEYLAMGKPTVATQTPTMEIFKDHVYLGETATDYIQLIEKALKENSPEKEQERIVFAQGHTWENNVTEIDKAIKQLN
jgi:teichuronic acid biosynthesis glycosyltransferase TuaH